MKIAFLTLAIAAALIATSQASSHIWGERASTDVLLYKGRVNAPAREYLRSKVKFNFPDSKVYNPYIISEVRVTDNKERNGGFAKIRKGPGYRNVRLTFKSDRRQDIDYTVEIYGNPKSAIGPIPSNSIHLPNPNAQSAPNAGGSEDAAEVDVQETEE